MRRSARYVPMTLLFTHYYSTHVKLFCKMTHSLCTHAIAQAPANPRWQCSPAAFGGVVPCRRLVAAVLWRRSVALSPADAWWLCPEAEQQRTNRLRTYAVHLDLCLHVRTCVIACAPMRANMFSQDVHSRNVCTICLLLSGALSVFWRISCHVVRRA